MHLAMRPNSSTLSPGSKFAVRLTQEALPLDTPRDNFALLRLLDGAGVFHAVDDAGSSWTSDDGRSFVDAAGTKATLAWTLPLPEVVDPLDYVAAHLHPAQPYPRRTTARPHLLLVTAVEGVVASCIPLARTGRTDRFSRQWPDDLRIWNDGFAAGDLVVSANLIEGLDEVGAIFDLHQHGTVARYVKADDIGRLLPEFTDGGVDYATFAEYENLFLVAREGGRPEECVVLFGDPDELAQPIVLAWSGPEIAGLRHPRHPASWSVEHAFRPGQKPKGLWLFSGAEFQMDFDADDHPEYYWEGEFSPATREDLSRHGLKAMDFASSVASPTKADLT